MRYVKTLTAIALALATQLPSLAADATAVKLYKNPDCGCCDLHAKHLKENGFKVEVIERNDMAAIKRKYGVPGKLEGCHTAIVDGYVVEGHVPAQFIRQLLQERRPVKGIALPGMPVGSPGMPGAKSGPLDVYLLESGSPPKVFGSF